MKEENFYREERPWGGYTLFVDNKKCSVKILEVKEQLSLQSHKYREERWFIISGEVSVSKGPVGGNLESSEFSIQSVLGDRRSPACKEILRESLAQEKLCFSLCRKRQAFPSMTGGKSCLPCSSYSGKFRESRETDRHQSMTGGGRFLFDEGKGKLEEYYLKKGDNIFIPKGYLHRMKNLGKEAALVLEISEGEYKEDDIVRYEDIYGREVLK